MRSANLVANRFLNLAVFPATGGQEPRERRNSRGKSFSQELLRISLHQNLTSATRARGVSAGAQLVMRRVRPSRGGNKMISRAADIFMRQQHGRAGRADRQRSK